MGEGARDTSSQLRACMHDYDTKWPTGEASNEGDRQQQLGTAGFGDTLYEGSHAM